MVTGIDDLQLTAEERDALTKQGFVSVEERASGRRYFKLRFRVGGEQKVRYLRNNPEVAEHL